MYKRKRNWHITEPRGTPLTQVASAEGAPSIWTCHGRSECLDLIQFSTGSPMAEDSLLASIPPCVIGLSQGEHGSPEGDRWTSGMESMLWKGSALCEKEKKAYLSNFLNNLQKNSSWPHPLLPLFENLADNGLMPVLEDFSSMDGLVK